MARAARIRTFVTLEPAELEFVRNLQRLIRKGSKSRPHPPLSRVIQAILLDYKLLLEIASNPNFLEAYEFVKSRRRKPPPQEKYPYG